jgi:hypothetical protein
MNQELKPKSSKVKLKLEQPYIMCAGRDKVECYYRGKVVWEMNTTKQIEFKSFGQLVKVMFVDDICITENWQDLKIIK